ncbi:hydrogenase nickel incorporation protein HypB [Thermoanaerobacterium sp. RBIITD]|uniref:hydrogenase nickel incorporation protein HypB n=1 Tax=Thermoanaerobacterium sp. RBIITD TaxID=1550240 RepID=UPI000BB7705D|nr:hydrogenase nickel incorporation protein HypB [Thermoanaerobacterium sp. RBIITD]SNX53897.1 hydrogenase nickel incorporation protein HypB [Thermoanaerobacterium sp. RBIITD]
MEIKIIKDVLEANNNIAEENKNIKDERNILMVNIIGSPGTGKTSFILKLIDNIDIPCGVIEGDIASDIDARKMAERNIPVIQINTGGECHLNANSINKALMNFDFHDGILFIENVGNLVCPSEFEIGEDFKLALSNVAEGDDKPYKYPLLFAKAKAVVINKIDLIPYFDFNKKYFYDGVKTLNDNAEIFEVSSKTGEGFEVLSKWLKDRYKEYMQKR